MSLQLAAKCISKTQIISHPRSIPFSKETKLASCHQYFPLLNPYEINRLFIILSKQQCQNAERNFYEIHRVHIQIHDFSLKDKFAKGNLPGCCAPNRANILNISTLNFCGPARVLTFFSSHRANNASFSCTMTRSSAAVEIMEQNYSILSLLTSHHFAIIFSCQRNSLFSPLTTASLFTVSLKPSGS